MRVFACSVLFCFAALAACDDDASSDEDDGGGSGGAGASGQTGGAAAAGGTTSDGGAASGGSGGTGGGGGGVGGSAAVELPTPNARFDYQLGGAYPPPAGIEIVVRDRTASVASGLYNICYVNGFQIQPGEESWWDTNHPTLVLRDGNGDPIVDVDWNEWLLDVSTADKRSAIADIVGGWIDGCGSDGFDAVEIDNLDSYSRSQGMLTQQYAVDFMALLSARAHAGGLAIAQKNSTELLSRRAEMGTDFAVSEECNTYSECQDYVDAYGDYVLAVEYIQSDYDTGCSAFPNLSIVLRDLDLVTPSDNAYIFDDC